MKWTRKRDRTGPFKMEFTPMIDVVFLLLIFFMCTLKFKTLEAKLATYLPTDKGSAPIAADLKPEEKIRVKLSLRGKKCICYLNGRAVGLLPGSERLVYERVRTLARALPESPAEIDPDPSVPHGFVVNVLDECIRAKVKSVEFTAALPELRKRG